MKPSTLKSQIEELYDQDFFEWTRRNAELMRAGRFAEADTQHVAEEIEDMGKSERRELVSRLEVLLTHLLKWRFQAHKRSRSWKATIRAQRSRLKHLLKQMPSLGPYLNNELPEVYPTSVDEAIAETNLPDDAFPPTCPFSLEQILDAEFFPE